MAKGELRPLHLDFIGTMPPPFEDSAIHSSVTRLIADIEHEIVMTLVQMVALAFQCRHMEPPDDPRLEMPLWFIESRSWEIVAVLYVRSLGNRTFPTPETQSQLVDAVITKCSSFNNTVPRTQWV